MKKLIYIFIVMFFYSCTPYGAQVEKSLRYAAHNRSQLEQVLQHYRKNDADSLKFKAAKFLIQNMPYHRSYSAEAYLAYCREMDSLFINCEEGDTIMAHKAQEISSRHQNNLTIEYDILNITADYLKWNIDYSFNVWQESDFLRHLTFDEFCEYVLPYKCLELQPMIKWKEQWRDSLRGELDEAVKIDELKYCVRRAAEFVTWSYRDADSIVRLDKKHINGINFTEILDMPTLAKQPYATCGERSRFGIMTCRSKGIPVSLDYTPNWADRWDTHYWNHVYVESRRSFDYEPMQTYPGGVHFIDTSMAKVFRQTYAPHPILIDAIEDGEKLPSSLGHIFIQDVTSEYCRTANIDISLKKNVKQTSDYAYLAVFDNQEWVPVDICKVKRGRALYNNVGLDILYMVVGYDNQQLIPLSSPFIVDVQKNITYVESSSNQKQNIRMYRKFPSYGHIYAIKKLLKGGQIEAADNPDFKGAVKMALLPDDHLLSGEVPILDSLPYRYWRLCSSYEGSTDMAELFFYDRDSIKLIEEKLIYPDVEFRNPVFDTHEHINDRDPLTYFAVDNNCDPKRWIGFDFGKPVAINKVIYIRRGDGNDVMPGDEYELHYWAGDKWHKHDSKIANGIYVDFTDVPVDRLYYIKGISRGSQNRIFLYNDGKLRWY